MAMEVSLRNLLREQLNICNEWELVREFATKGQDVYCIVVPPVGSRPKRVQVISPSHHTDQNAQYWDNGRKSFIAGANDGALDDAMKWATTKYGVTEWARSPFDRNARVPAEVVEAAKKKLAA